MKIVFLDFDGVVTAKNGTPGSYMTHGQNQYGATPACVRHLLRLLNETGAKVVVSSNWRKFAPDGELSIWRHPVYGEVRNPLPKFLPSLGGAYLENLPPIRHLGKAALAEFWLSARNDVESFVALDDMCVLEGYTTSCLFKDRYINTNSETGFTAEDRLAAAEILSRRA